MKYIKINLTIFCALFMFPFVANAQQPLPDEFRGEWFLTSAKSQERVLGSSSAYTTQSVALDDFSQQIHLLSLSIPTSMIFAHKFHARIFHPSWAKQVVAIINGNGQLEFLNFPENMQDEDLKTTDIEDFADFTAMSSSYQVAINAGIITLERDYVRIDPASGKRIEGILTLHYKQ